MHQQLSPAVTPQKGASKPKHLPPMAGSSTPGGGPPLMESSTRSFSPGLPSPATSPSMAKIGGQRRLHALKGNTAVEERLLRDLRSDILEAKHFVDGQQGKAALNPEARQLEADVLNAKALPLAEQLVFLLHTLQREVHDVAAVCGFSQGETRGLTGALLTGCVQLVEMEDQLAAPGTEGEEADESRRDDSEPTVEAGGGNSDKAAAATAFHFLEGMGSPTLRAPHPSRAFPDEPEATPQEKSPLTAAAATSMLARRASQRSFRRLSLRRPTDTDGAAADAPMGLDGITPLSPDSVTLLRSLGVKIDAGCDLEGNHLVLKLVQAAEGIAAKQRDFENRLRVSGEVAKKVEQQHRLEVAALRLELQNATEQAATLERELHGSRFGIAPVRAIATINDTPMSFDVEKKYQRDLHRTELRVQQLDALTAKMYDDGEADRSRAKQLAADVVKDKAEIRALQRVIAKMKDERTEVDALLAGITNTRTEEARMGSAAVEQLESRIGSLRLQLSREQRTVEILTGNLHMLMTEWCVASKELADLKSEHSIVCDEFCSYKGIYSKEMAERLETATKQLLRVYDERDKEEGQRAVTKQLADDATNAYKALSEEFKGLSEKLRGSTEWKLLSIRAPEECKQLSVRLSVLVNEKEKRETSASKPLKDRIDLYRRRADEECARRKIAHMEEIGQQRAASYDDEFRAVQLRSKQRRDQDASSSQGGGGTPRVLGYRKQPAELIDDYVAAAKREPLSFSAFYEQLYPSVDS